MRYSGEALRRLPPGYSLTLLAPREDTEEDVPSSPPSFTEEEAAEAEEEEGYRDFQLLQVTH